MTGSGRAKALDETERNEPAGRWSKAEVRRRLRAKARLVRDAAARPFLRGMAMRRLRSAGRGKPHRLGGELIVSLTSYPARFGTAHLTIACLLDQSVRPDRVILWVAHADEARLTPELLALRDQGLEIRTCDDLRSFKKLLPALEAFPNAHVATADDDLYYRRDWLEQLVAGAGPGIISAHRVHRIRRAADGSFLPYVDWENDVGDSRARTPSPDLVATSGAGALFSPGQLGDLVADRKEFTRLCPNSDDLWFHWCARLAETRFVKVGGKFLLTGWEPEQGGALWDSNRVGGNDAAVKALTEALGYPDADEKPRETSLAPARRGA